MIVVIAETDTGFGYVVVGSSLRSWAERFRITMVKYGQERGDKL